MLAELTTSQIGRYFPVFIATARFINYNGENIFYANLFAGLMTQVMK